MLSCTPYRPGGAELGEEGAASLETSDQTRTKSGLGPQGHREIRVETQLLSLRVPAQGE